MWVLDTNTVIYFFKGEGNVASNLFRRSPKDIAIPTIVVYELRVGIAKTAQPAKRMQQLSELIASARLLPFGDPEADAAAHLRAMLESRGQPIGPHDTLIAGTALANGATLVTRNLKEFARADGLRLENWY